MGAGGTEDPVSERRILALAGVGGPHHKTRPTIIKPMMWPKRPEAHSGGSKVHVTKARLIVLEERFSGGVGRDGIGAVTPHPV